MQQSSQRLFYSLIELVVGRPSGPTDSQLSGDAFHERGALLDLERLGGGHDERELMVV
jgi:hypothetical protein